MMAVSTFAHFFRPQGIFFTAVPPVATDRNWKKSLVFVASWAAESYPWCSFQRLSNRNWVGSSGRGLKETGANTACFEHKLNWRAVWRASKIYKHLFEVDSRRLIGNKGEKKGGMIFNRGLWTESNKTHCEQSIWFELFQPPKCPLSSWFSKILNMT